MNDVELAALEERSCTGKQRWGGRRAREIAAEQTERAGTLITAYRCMFCDAWHVGHPLSAEGMKHLAEAIRYRAQRPAPTDDVDTWDWGRCYLWLLEHAPDAQVRSATLDELPAVMRDLVKERIGG